MMDVKGSINIKGRRMTVSSIISESYVYEASDMTSHVVSVNMTDGGVVSVKIDGTEFSSYRKEIMESHTVDTYVEKLHKRLAGAYESISDYYLRMHAQSEKIWKENEISNQIKNLRCEKYKETPFSLAKPDVSEIESDLREDAKAEDINDQNEIDKYISSHLEDSYNYRLSKWENLNKYHSFIQSVIAKVINDRNQKLYETKRNTLQAIIDGDPTYIGKKIKELEETLVLPYSTDIEYVYSPDNGHLVIEMESPLNINIPQKKICVSDAGNLQIVRTTPQEDIINKTRSKISSIFYIAWTFWNISTKIQKITITNWQIKNQIGICWFSFIRSKFEDLEPEKVDIIELCKDVEHVFDLNNQSLSPMRYNLFKYAIQQGKFDDSTLLRFANAEHTIEKKNIVKKDMEEPVVESNNNSTSINDLDFGYDLTIKPEFDNSFANWCFKLIEYDECSLSLFIKEFGWSLDRAKDFMGKLLFLHIVGGKDSDGKRKVLVKTEAELEYKLSWVYYNESWKH